MVYKRLSGAAAQHYGAQSQQAAEQSRGARLRNRSHAKIGNFSGAGLAKIEGKGRSQVIVIRQVARSAA